MINRYFSRKGIWKKKRIIAKPILTAVHIQNRLQFAIKYQDNNWECWVDVDEKYFLAWTPSTIHCPANERTPVGKVQSKSMVNKVMVLCAIGRPTPDGKCSGKIGIWRVADFPISTKDTKKRKRGEMFAKDVTMDKARFKKMMLEDVIPAARKCYEGYPWITFQMDNARPHGNREFANLIESEANEEPGPRVRIVYQPAQSPDMNVCDLGIFRSMHVGTRTLRARGTAENEGDLQDSDDEEEENNWGEENPSALVDSQNARGVSSSAESEVGVGERVVCGWSKSRDRDGVSNRCSICNGKERNLTQYGKEWIACKSRRSWYHLACLRAKEIDVPQGALMRETQWWMCPDCTAYGCRFPRFHVDRCIRCDQRTCRVCDEKSKSNAESARFSGSSPSSLEESRASGGGNVEETAECSHWVRCDYRGGRFHSYCLTELEERTFRDALDAGEEWECPTCERAERVVEEQLGFVVNEKGERVMPVDDSDCFKYCNVWSNSKDSICKAVFQVFDELKSETISAIFETKTQMLKKIIEVQGGNDFKMFHFRKRRENQE